MGFDHQLFDKAVRFVLEQQSCSVSQLQREFGMSYFGARAMISEMQNRNVVGRPRMGQFLVLWTLEEYFSRTDLEDHSA